MSSAVTVFCLVCSVNVTESWITLEWRVRDMMKATSKVTHVFKEYFQTMCLHVDETRDMLHTSMAGKTTNSGFCYTYGGQRIYGSITVMKTLDVIMKNFLVALSSTLSESLVCNYVEQQSNGWKHQVHLSIPWPDMLIVGWGGWVWVISAWWRQ